MDNGTGQQSTISELNRYVEMTNRIRELSSPLLDGMKSAEEYRVRLLENFRRIGDIALENNAILEEVYYPILNSNVPLPDETVEDMRAFAGAMLNAYTLENLDLPIIYQQAERLLADARAKGETGYIIRALDEFLCVAYTMVNVSERLFPYYDFTPRYSRAGRKAAEEILEYLSPEKFLTLPDAASRESVLIVSRYIAIFFGNRGLDETPEEKWQNLDLLVRSIALCDDPLYREHAPGYDWDYHKFRALEYIARQSEDNNERAYGPDHLLFIREKAKEYVSFVTENPEEFSRYTSKRMLELQRIRDDYLTGELPLEAYKKELVALMNRAAEDNTLKKRLEQYFVIPVEYLRVLDPKHLSEEEKACLLSIYKRLIVVIHQLGKKSISFMLTFLADALSDFIEVDDGMTFEDMALSVMVALHPPTFVHTLTVADIATCLAGHVIDRIPEYMIGFMGFTSAEEVQKHREEILDFTKHAARCHDVGKLFITETIIMYGRTLYENEFELIRIHPVIGARKLEHHEHTKRYAGVALGHHKWYDDSAGYPADFRRKDCPDRAVIDIVTIADCMDAATDVVGRSYKEGKTFDLFLKELEEGSGTRYSPALVGLFSVPEVKNDLSALLVTCRDENYRNAFRLLQEMERHGE